MLLDKINADLKAAMIARDDVKKTTLQGLKSTIKYVEIEQKKELDDAEVTKVLQKEAKKRKESISLYEQGNNQAAADKEKLELELIEVYLPEQASEADIEAAVDEALSGIESPSMKDMGTVMGSVKSKLGGAVDGSVVAAKVKAKLS